MLPAPVKTDVEQFFTFRSSGSRGNVPPSEMFLQVFVTWPLTRRAFPVVSDPSSSEWEKNILEIASSTRCLSSNWRRLENHFREFQTPPGSSPSHVFIKIRRMRKPERVHDTWPFSNFSLNLSHPLGLQTATR